jgi:hypothetical protein
MKARESKVLLLKKVNFFGCRQIYRGLSWHNWVKSKNYRDYGIFLDITRVCFEFYVLYVIHFFLGARQRLQPTFSAHFSPAFFISSFFVAGENGGGGRREERVGHAPRPRCPPARPPVGGLRQPRPLQGGLAGVLARGHWPRLSGNRQVNAQKIGPTNFSWWTKKIIKKGIM